MQQPSIPLALALSLAAGVASAALMMPPARHAAAGPRPAAHAPLVREARQSCEGYQTLHVLLRSVRDAERFRRGGNCLSILLNGKRHPGHPQLGTLVSLSR